MPISFEHLTRAHTTLFLVGVHPESLLAGDPSTAPLFWQRNLEMSRLFVAALVAIIGVGADYCNAENPTSSSDAVRSLVEQAIAAEAKGDSEQRAALLEQAIERPDAPDLAYAMAGRLRNQDGEWVSVDQSASELQSSKQLQAYSRQRASVPDTVLGNWQMVQWCVQSAMPGQARAHCERILQLQPSNQIALRMLGYVPIDGQWVSPADQFRMRQDIEYTQASFKQFGDDVHRVLQGLNSDRVNAKRVAVERLNAIDDPLAAPVIASQIASQPFEVAKAGIDWLDSVDVTETSRFLAAIAVGGQSSQHKLMAADALAQRPLRDYVPELLQMLQSPSAIRMQPIYGPNGELAGLQTAVGTESLKTRDVRVFQSLIRGEQIVRTRRLPRPRRQAVIDEEAIEEYMFETYNQLVQQMRRQQIAVEARRNVAQLEARNRQQREQNVAVSAVLSKIANRAFDGNPEAMWTWWDEVNDTRYESEKPSRYSYTSAITSDSPPLYVPPPPSCECFVAGTLVQTHRGPVEIQRVMLGDLVLSQHASSGALEWKPVLRCTQRPKERIVALVFGDEQLRCTQGHLFWLAGSGWVKAKELSEGDSLCTASSIQKIKGKSDEPAEVTYNLVVADNANYFVGRNLLLSHDVTSPLPDRQPRLGAASLKHLPSEIAKY